MAAGPRARYVPNRRSRLGARAAAAWPGCARGKDLHDTCRHRRPERRDSRPGRSFSGRRAGLSGRPRQGEHFDLVQTIDIVMPGSGPVSVTTKVSDVTPGEWIIWAAPAGRAGQGPRAGMLPSPSAAAAVRPEAVPVAEGGTRCGPAVPALASRPGPARSPPDPA